VRFPAENSSARHSHSRHSHHTHPGALDSRRPDAGAYRSCLVANQFRGHRQVGLRVAAGVLWKPRRWPDVRTPQRNPGRPGVRRTLARSTRGPDPTPSPCGTSLRLVSDRTVGCRRSTRPLGAHEIGGKQAHELLDDLWQGSGTRIARRVASGLSDPPCGNSAPRAGPAYPRLS
jgi:hypothetical protein